MAAYEITMSDQSVQIVEADAYQMEGPLTTFFRTDGGHGRLDSWATRLASFRSADVLMIRRLERFEHAPADRPHLDLVVSAGS